MTTPLSFCHKQVPWAFPLPKPTKELKGSYSFCWQACGKQRHFSGDLECNSELISLITCGGEILLFDRDYTLAHPESQSNLSSKPLCMRHSGARPSEIHYHVWSSQNIWWGSGRGVGSTVTKAKAGNWWRCKCSFTRYKKITHKWVFVTQLVLHSGWPGPGSSLQSLKKEQYSGKKPQFDSCSWLSSIWDWLVRQSTLYLIVEFW